MLTISSLRAKRGNHRQAERLSIGYFACVPQIEDTCGSGGGKQSGFARRLHCIRTTSVDTRQQISNNLYFVLLIHNKMSLHLDDLTIDISSLDLADLRENWKWLIADMTQVLIISKLGDMFLQGKNEAIYWLDTGAGLLTQIAGSINEFDSLLKEDDNINEWFLPHLIDELEDNGQMLAKNQVYSFVKPPAIGGEYVAGNVKATDISVHFAFTGQIFEQIKDLPNGTKVDIKLVD
jgi:hypothetical protein